MENFQHSELILNADGSVYHLHLLPHHISDIIITVGDQNRVKTVSKHFDKIFEQHQHREFCNETGTIGNKNITVISTGIGTDNIDIVMNELHLLANYDFEKKAFKANFKKLTFIRIGTSGAIQPDIAVDSLLVSEYAIGVDNLLHFYQAENSIEEITLLEKFKMHNYFHNTIHPYIARSSEKLFSLFSDNFMTGVTLTAPGFYAPQGRKLNAPIKMEKFYNDIISFRYAGKRITNIEMETAGIYGLSKILGHDAISCNALLANRSTGIFSKTPEATIEKLINRVLEIIIEKL
ncbi:MAG: nucleoside phosphorylase [Fimbriimonadaceae bacterium]|nr:nucleoside phosphorylase [Chitinophagales bacterium]